MWTISSSHTTSSTFRFNCVGRLFEHEVYLRLVDLDKPQSEVPG